MEKFGGLRMGLFAPYEIKFSPWKAIVVLVIFISLPIISYQLGFIKASLNGFKEKSEKLDNSVSQLNAYVSLTEENMELRIKLTKTEQALFSAVFTASFTNGLMKCWEDRSAVREIIIQSLLRKNPIYPTSSKQIKYQKRILKNGDIVRYCGNLAPEDYDLNGYVFPHVLQKMPVGIFVRLSDKDESRAFVYNFKERNMYCKKIIGFIPQQNLLFLK